MSKDQARMQVTSTSTLCVVQLSEVCRGATAVASPDVAIFRLLAPWSEDDPGALADRAQRPAKTLSANLLLPRYSYADVCCELTTHINPRVTERYAGVFSYGHLPPGSIAQKVAHQPRHRLRPLQVRQVAGAVDQGDPGARDPLREVVGVGRRDEAVLLPPDDQRGGADAVDVLLEPAVGDRPDELPGAGLRPGKADLRVDSLVGIVGQAEEALGRLALGVREQQPPQLLWRDDHRVPHRPLVPPQTERGDERQLADALGQRGGDLAGEHPAEGVADERRRAQLEAVEQLAVVDDQVPPVVDLVDRVGIVGVRARMPGRV